MAQLNMMYQNNCQGLSNDINWSEYWYYKNLNGHGDTSHFTYF